MSMEIVSFYGTTRDVDVTPYFQVGTTILGVMRVDGILYTVERHQDETVWHVVRRWTMTSKEVRDGKS